MDDVQRHDAVFPVHAEEARGGVPGHGEGNTGKGKGQHRGVELTNVVEHESDLFGCPRRAIYVKQGEKAYCLSEEREKDDTGSARGTDMAASCAASITTRD